MCDNFQIKEFLIDYYLKHMDRSFSSEDLPEYFQLLNQLYITGNTDAVKSHFMYILRDYSDLEALTNTWEYLPTVIIKNYNSFKKYTMNTEDIINLLGDLEKSGDYRSLMMVITHKNTEINNMLDDSLMRGESSFPGWNNTSIGNIARIALRCSDESIKNKALNLLTNYMEWLKNGHISNQSILFKL